MTRWHVASCTAPLVYTGQDSIPCCKTCGATAHGSLASLTQQASSSNPLPAIPPDEPMGQLNLHWPPDVPWTDTLETHNAPIHKPAQRKEEPTGRASNATDNVFTHNSNGPSLNTTNAIYDYLDKQQFRLITLESNKDISSTVVHLEMNIYPLDRCPEYETVSYSWGGEDGNSSLCQPVYIGEFWDILLQTRNCFSMLQYLRPEKGCRTVWIDAICINQADLQERNEQVQIMGKIYSQCNQVLLWLGADLVRPNPGTYPSRRPLQNISLDTEICNMVKQTTTLASILECRYFSRVWVVQELILAPRVIMPVGNTIFFAHPRTEPGFLELNHGSSRASLKILWMKYITRGRVEAQGLYDVVSLLDTSQASDARDRVFGVLGLLSSHSSLTALRPDYSLSHKSVFVGFVAHSICVGGKYFLLHQACGIFGSPDLPSWAPSYHNLETDWNHVLNKVHAGHPEQKDVGRHVCATALKINSDEHRVLTRTYCDPGQVLAFRPVSIGYEVNRVMQFQRIPGHDLHTRLHSNTGRLSINLKRVFAIREAPVPINLQSLQGCGIPLKMNGSVVKPFVYLIGYKPLHTIVRVDDEVWILETSGTQKVFLVLRKNGEPQTFSLVATCCFVFCIFYEPVPRYHQPLFYDRGVYRIPSLRLSTFQIQGLMYWEYNFIQKLLEPCSWVERTTCRHFLRLVLRASKGDSYEVLRPLKKWEGLPARWEELYASFFPPDIESWIDGDYYHSKVREGSGSLDLFEGAGWEVVSRGEYIIFRREMVQLEDEFQMMIYSPTSSKYLEICLSICRRTYGDYALRDIDMLTLETTSGYQDTGKADKDWDRWDMNRLEPDLNDLGLIDVCRNFDLDGSQYRVTIV